jgi:hypothetical protein
MSDHACDVTVVIPTRNRVRLLSQALRSAMSQVDVSCEIRVVDDGSTDGTAECVERIGDDRVTLVVNPVPRGVAAARNEGIMHARGRWLAFLDDDDLWAPTWLRTALDTARRTGAGAVYGARWLVDEDRRVTGVHLAQHPAAVHSALASHNALGGPSGVLVHTEVMTAAGCFDERLSALADWEAWIRVLDLCRAAPVLDLLVAYTVHPNNMHLRDPFGVLAEFDRFVEIVAARGDDVGTARAHLFTRWLAVEAGNAGHRGRAARLWLRTFAVTRQPGDLMRAGRAFTRGAEVLSVTLAAPDWLVDDDPEGHVRPVIEAGRPAVVEHAG